MPPIDESVSFEPKGSAAAERRSKPASASTPDQSASVDLVSFTVESASGRLVKIESVDAAGTRHDLGDEEKARLIRANAKTTLQGLVEQAFQAGIDCVLGEDAGEKDAPESKEDAELARLLLQSLMERSGVKRLVQRDVLEQAIIGTLIEHAAASGPTAAH